MGMVLVTVIGLRESIYTSLICRNCVDRVKTIDSKILYLRNLFAEFLKGCLLNDVLVIYQLKEVRQISCNLFQLKFQKSRCVGHYCPRSHCKVISIYFSISNKIIVYV